MGARVGNGALALPSQISPPRANTRIRTLGTPTRVVPEGNTNLPRLLALTRSTGWQFCRFEILGTGRTTDQVTGGVVYVGIQIGLSTVSKLIPGQIQPARSAFPVDGQTSGTGLKPMESIEI